MTERQDTDRVVEAQIEIAAPADAVWKALTEADELARWFPLRARVEPGEGGSIWLSWEELYEGEARIRIWEPGRHLRTGYLPPDEAAERPGALELLVDYHIEARGDTTVLRVVHSGFGREGQWDDEYEGVRRGWAYELRSLRHYLERHAGEHRRVAWAMRRLQIPEADAWARLMGGDGLLAEGTIAERGEGDAYSIRTASGLRLEGTVHINQPPLDFSGTVANLNDALFRLGLEPGKEGRTAVLWLATYGLAQETVSEIADGFDAIFERTLGVGDQ